MDYPDAPRVDVVDELHGHRISDPYRWLEDPAEPRTTAWSAAQDQLARGYLDALPGRERLAERLRELLATGMVTPPSWRGDRAFFLRRTADQQHAVLVVADRDGAERVLVDPGALDPDGTTTLDA